MGRLLKLGSHHYQPLPFHTTVGKALKLLKTQSPGLLKANNSKLSPSTDVHSTAAPSHGLLWALEILQLMSQTERVLQVKGPMKHTGPIVSITDLVVTFHLVSMSCFFALQLSQVPKLA